MSSRTEIVYPKNGRITFDGGLCSKYERSIIPDNESPDCQNVVFNNGAVETRAGSSRLNTTSVGSFVGDGIYTRHDSAGNQTMVVFAGGTAWALTGTSTFATIASAQSVFTAGVRVGTAEYENHIFVGNGGVTPYKYNGTNWTRHGVPRASSSGFTGTVSGSGGTFPSASYFYKVSFVNSQVVEGDVSTASTAFAVGVNGSVELTGIPVAPTSHGVNFRRLYRASGTAGTFERIATISDNTTTVFSDTYFPAGATAPTDQGEPPNYSVVVYHQGRLFCNDPANPNYVWYSEALEPYTFKTTSFKPVGDATFDIVRGLDVYENGILVRCVNSVHLIAMPSTDPEDWVTIRIRSQYGSKSPYGSFLWNNRLMFPAMQNDKFVGFAAVSGSSLDPEATVLDIATAGSDLQSDRIEPEMFAVNETYVGNISSTVFKNKAYITVTDGGDSTTNNKVYVFDFSISNIQKRQRAAWSPLDGLDAAQFTVYNGRLYYLSSTANGTVYQLETSTYSDTSTAIDSYFWTKEFSGLPGHENFQKDFRWARLLVELAGVYYMTVAFRVDSDVSEGTTIQLDLDPGGTTWPFTWGVDTWDAGSSQREIRIPLGPARGKRIQFKFTNQNAAGQRFKVHAMTFSYNLKGAR
jgi:hypothetical protein